MGIGCPFTDTKQQPAKQGRDLHKNSGGPRTNDVQAKGLHEVYSNLNYHIFLRIDKKHSNDIPQHVLVLPSSQWHCHLMKYSHP